MHITSTTCIFLNCVLNRNRKCEGQKQCNMDQTLIWINHWFLIDIKVNYCALKTISEFVHLRSEGNMFTSTKYAFRLVFLIPKDCEQCFSIVWLVQKFGQKLYKNFTKTFFVQTVDSKLGSFIENLSSIGINGKVAFCFSKLLGESSSLSAQQL